MASPVCQSNSRVRGTEEGSGQQDTIVVVKGPMPRKWQLRILPPPELRRRSPFSPQSPRWINEANFLGTATVGEVRSRYLPPTPPLYLIRVGSLLRNPEINNREGKVVTSTAPVTRYQVPDTLMMIWYLSLPLRKGLFGRFLTRKGEFASGLDGGIKFH